MRHRHPGPKVRYHTIRNNVMYRKRPMHVQTLIFPKKGYNREKALKWAKEHGFQHYTSREEGDSIRVRQFPPSDVKRYGGTFPIGKDVKGVYAEVDKDKYKDMPFQRLRRKFKISKYGDDDKDKVPNYKDCKPWDKKRQDEDIDFIDKDITTLEEQMELIRDRKRFLYGESQKAMKLSNSLKELTSSEEEKDRIDKEMYPFFDRIANEEDLLSWEFDKKNSEYLRLIEERRQLGKPKWYKDIIGKEWNEQRENEEDYTEDVE